MLLSISTVDMSVKSIMESNAMILAVLVHVDLCWKISYLFSSALTNILCVAATCIHVQVKRIFLNLSTE